MSNDRIEIQFAGCAPEPKFLPLNVSPFSSDKNQGMFAYEAQDIIENALMSDADENGWCSGDANGEVFQVRRI